MHDHKLIFNGDQIYEIPAGFWPDCLTLLPGWPCGQPGKREGEMVFGGSYGRRERGPPYPTLKTFPKRAPTSHTPSLPNSHFPTIPFPHIP